MRQQEKPIKRGDRIHTETPFVYVLKSKYQKERCDNCLIECKAKKCSNCQYVYYCGRSCQMESWNLHKIECPFLKRIYPRTVPDAARMLSLLIIKLKNGGEMIRGYYTEKNYRRFRDLMSHYSEIKIDGQRREHLQSLHAILNEMMGSAIVPNETELLSIYGRLITNGFNILDAEMNSIATAIYLGVSITDHSCQPNAVATFEGTTLHIHATENMSNLDWSKIFISYVDLLNTSEQRRNDLMANYYFLCTCSKCIDPRGTLEMNAAACPNKHCSEYVNIDATKCSRCGAGITPKYRNAFNEAIVLTKSHFEGVRDMAYLDVSKVCLDKQRLGNVHPLNLCHIKTLDAAFEASIEVGKWSDALNYGNQLFSGFRKYYGEWNPLLGLLYMKVAKIQLYQAASKEALHNFLQAQKILEVTHGRDHTLVQNQLAPLIMQARQESSHV